MSDEQVETKLERIGWLVLLLAFTSGFIIMSVELLGGRILAPYFGSSIYVWGSIISIFMVALAMGYLIGGRLSINRPNLGLYGLFFLLQPLAYCRSSFLLTMPWMRSFPRLMILVTARYWPLPFCFSFQPRYSV